MLTATKREYFSLTSQQELVASFVMGRINYVSVIRHIYLKENLNLTLVLSGAVIAVPMYLALSGLLAFFRWLPNLGTKYENHSHLISGYVTGNRISQFDADYQIWVRNGT